VLRKNSSLHVLEGLELSPENQVPLDSFLRRNRFITSAKSLDNAALSVSRSAVVDALLEPSQDEFGINASWMILHCHATSLFGDRSQSR
jgi:hypothetical protein